METRAEQAAARLRRPGGPWSCVERDAVNWTLEHERGDRLVLVRGRQVATAEDLEVLVVGTADPIEDGRPFAEIIEQWIDREVQVIVPWGFGKWTGSRASLVSDAFERYAAAGLRLGDTGLRARWLRPPRIFRRSALAGYPILVGSDPFPFPDRGDVAGSHGFRLRGVPPEAGWADMLRLLRNAGGELTRFGRPLGAITFVRLQARMQMKKRFGDRRA
ncbi:MAG: hypothetical protein ACR2GQ_00130 [Gemmatimonadota bacterium]